MGSKQFVLAEVKQIDGTSEHGEFEAILSAPTLDRDNEVIDTGAFEPLPASIPVHAYHDFRDPVGRGVPFYDDGVLKLRGFYASTPRAQEIRTLVAEGVIASMSVGFMSATRISGEDGKDHIVKAEILEGSMVSIPSNREAAVLVAKSIADRDGKQLSSDLHRRLRDSGRERWGADDVWVWLDDFDVDESWAVFAVESDDNPVRYVRVDVTRSDDGGVSLGDDETEVQPSTGYVPKTSGSVPVSKTPVDPETGSGASPDVTSGGAPDTSPAEAGAVPASVRAVIAEAQAYTV